MQSDTKRPLRLTAFRVAGLLLGLQLALVVLTNALATRSFQNLSVNDLGTSGFDAGQGVFILWKTYAPGQWPEIGDMARYGIPGLRYVTVPGICRFVEVSFFWTFGLNAIALLWLGRRSIARAWRHRPRWPRVRITIERRPRAPA